MPSTSPLATVVPAYRLRRDHPLRERIRELKIKQTDMAAVLECSDSELSRWLRNERTMPFSVERALSEIPQQVEVSGQ